MCLREITKYVPWKPAGEIWYKLVKKYCLEDGTIIYKPFYQTVSTGWKLFKIYNDRSKRTIETQYDRTKHKYYYYKSGFHFYDKDIIKHTNYWKNCYWLSYSVVVLQCAVWNIQTYGEDTYGKACVAKSFMPIAEVNYNAITDR